MKTIAFSIAGLAFLAAASAAVPPNDNYLASSSLNQPGTPLTLETPFSVDTTDATVQANMFDFNSQGQPFNGPPQAEPLSLGRLERAGGRLVRLADLTLLHDHGSVAENGPLVTVELWY